MSIEFTREINFPENFVSLINENAYDDRKLSKSYGELIEILVINGDTEEIDKNLISWTVIKASSTKIDIGLAFKDPISVSAGYSPDLLFI